MKNIKLRLSDKAVHAAATALISASLLLASTTAVYADEAQAKQILKNMSDYLVEQKAFTFEYDSILGVRHNSEPINDFSQYFRQRVQDEPYTTCMPGFR